MEILIGFIMALLGISLLTTGVKWFIKSDSWFSFAKSLLVSLVGLLLLGLSIDPLKGLFY
ncbi:MAG: hypothetical protein ACD_37C00234G0001 [uncultured bacterium]|nr:MAG: hypothetical protein ACD_37C00234G0001 [uncultured bacterium]